jgi:type II secretion system protein C
MREIMVDFSKVLGRVSVWPWKASFVVLGLSFILSTVLSTVVSQMLMPGEGRNIFKLPAGSSAISIPNPTSSLNQAGVDTIIKRNIFNSEGGAEDKVDNQPKQQEKVTEVVKSDLPVKLTGTIYGGDPYSGIALVENTTKRTINSFMVNDTLVQSAVIKEIHKERIIVDNNGRLEYIEVDSQELTRSKRRKKAPAVAASSGVAALATEPPPTVYKEEGFERKEKEISMTQAYRNKLLTADFTKVLQDAKASPNIVDGELKGFVLTRIRKDSIYEKAGLQNDDIVEEINGIPLTDTSQAIKLLQSLRNESEIEVRINRGGSVQKFILSVR